MFVFKAKGRHPVFTVVSFSSYAVMCFVSIVEKRVAEILQRFFLVAFPDKERYVVV